MSEAPKTPNTSTFDSGDDAQPSKVRRYAPLAGVVALMGTIVVAGTALASTRTAPEIDPSAVTVEASVPATSSSTQETTTSSTTTSRAQDDDRDDRDDHVDDDVNGDANYSTPTEQDTNQAPAYITPQVPLTYQEWDDDDDWDDDDWDDDYDDWDDDDWDDDWDDDDDDD